MPTRLSFATIVAVPGMSAPPLVVLTALAFQVAAGALAPSLAGGVNLGCTGAGGAVSCSAGWGPGGDPHIRAVPTPLTADASAQYDARDRKWVERCHPVIRQDRYGVARYHYAAPGCEFGIIGD